MPKSDIGWVAKVLGNLQDWSSNRPTRIRKSLIETGDRLVDHVHAPILEKIENRQDLTHEEKNTHHWCRQWKANRAKLK